jgi:chorismate dehydratase
MVHSDLAVTPSSAHRPRVCAVSYLNTAPLVWGALHGPQQGSIDLSFAVPSRCADQVASGAADVGIIPVIEMDRMGLDSLPGLGIACRGPVRSILLASAVPFERIKRVAVDSGSRTSVQLTRVILARKYGVEPELIAADPDLETMLGNADAALLIGDAALGVDPLDLDIPCLDLGDEWVSLTGLPMVFALWSGRKEALTPQLHALLRESCRYGLAHLDDIIEQEGVARGFARPLVEQYLTRNIVFQLGEAEYAGLRHFLAAVKDLDSLVLSEARAHDDATGSR